MTKEKREKPLSKERTERTHRMYSNHYEAKSRCPKNKNNKQRACLNVGNSGGCSYESNRLMILIEY